MPADDNANLVRLLYGVFLNRHCGDREGDRFATKIAEPAWLQPIIRAFLDSAERRDLMSRSPFYVWPMRREDFERLSSLRFRVRATSDQITDTYLLFALAEFGLHSGEFEEALSLFRNSAIEARFPDWAAARTIVLKRALGQDVAVEKRKLLQMGGISSVNVFEHDLRLIEAAPIDQKAVATYRTQLLSSSTVIAGAIGDFLHSKIDLMHRSEALCLFEAAYRLQGYPLGCLDSFKIAFDDMTFGVEDALSHHRSRSGPDIIAVGGFFFSGSSAIYDYLRGFESVAPLASRDVEVPLLYAYWKWFINATPSRKGMVQFFFQYLLPMTIPKDAHHDPNLFKADFSVPIGLLQRGGNSSFLQYAEFLANNAKILALGSLEGKREALRRLCMLCASIDLSNEKTLILNQAPSALGVEAIAALPPGTKFIAVYRDPRDQFVDQVANGAIEAGVYSDVSGFISKFKADRNAFESKSADLMQSYDIFGIQFEDFVLSAPWRQKLCSALGLDYQTVSAFFDPEVSKKNIGKFRSFENREAIERIEQELSTYLYSPETIRAGDNVKT